MTKDELQAIAWRDFILFAWQEPQMRQAFESATGLKLLRPATSPLEKLIDVATGAPEEVHYRYAVMFTAWVTVWHWGLEEAPEAYQKEFAEIRKKGLAFSEPTG